MTKKKKAKKPIPFEGETQIQLFKNKEIRKVFHEGEWHFSIIDMIAILTDSPEPSSYWAKIKLRDDQLSPNWTKLKMPSKDGRLHPTDCTTVEGMFRIIQSVPSPKAEPFKRWLAKVGYERIQEFQDPELAIKRAVTTYKVKGYNDRWISERIKTIQSRKDLTEEWSNRGITDNLEFALLTNIISEETFDLKVKEHKERKDLQKHDNLRDHMTPIELALTMLGEVTTTAFTKVRDTYGFDENKEAAKDGGTIAGNARRDIEKKLEQPVVSDENYLTESQKSKRLNESDDAQETIDKFLKGKTDKD